MTGVDVPEHYYNDSESEGSGDAAWGYPVVKGDPKRDYVLAGPGRYAPKIPQLLASDADEITRNFGLRVYESMLCDPAVKSSFLALKLSIVSGPTTILPAVRPKGFRAGKSFTPKGGAKVSPEETRSLEIAAFCERDIKRIRPTFKGFLLQLLDAMAFGCKLAEKVREECEFGPDKGKLVIKSLNVKPQYSWKFVVNAVMDPTGILTYAPPGVGSQSGYLIVPIEKFVRFAWMPVNNDPRGTSALRAAYNAWNLKTQILPFYYSHLRRFGSPSLDMEMAEADTENRFPLDPLTGLEVTTGGKVTPTVRMTQALLAYQNNSVIVHPAGSKLTVVEPGSNGESFLSAFDFLDRQICLAIGLQARSSLEAKHGSKADSDTAENTRGLVTAFAREEIGGTYTREVLYESVKLNFGEEDAEMFTPELRVGTTEEQDKPAMISAMSSAGWSIGPSQFEEVDVMLDVPERDMEADQAFAEKQAAMQADLQAKVKGAAGPPPPGGQGAKPPAKGARPAAKPKNPGKKKPTPKKVK